jgi:endonuclease/exonuclease/phosphatase family metal-dependent hydrolase
MSLIWMQPPDNEISRGTFGPPSGKPWSRKFIRIVTWNIDRGLHLSGIFDFLRRAEADILLLQEVDLHVRRTHFRDIACDLAKSLSMNYVFGKEFEELGAGTRNTPAYHGAATLSPWPLLNGRVMRFRRQSDFWNPRWYIPRTAQFQRRRGGRIGLAADAWIESRRIITYNLHLESRGDDDLRLQQLGEVLAEARQPSDSSLTIVGGDFNMDLSKRNVSAMLRSIGLYDAVRLPEVPTTPVRPSIEHTEIIDWILASRDLRSVGQVHSSIRASDHYPVSMMFAADAVPPVRHLLTD